MYTDGIKGAVWIQEQPQCQVSICVYSSFDAYQGSQWCYPFLSRIWTTLKMFGKPKHARMGSFGNVPCLTFIPYTISLRNRENHLIIPLNSHENHPGSERNHSPCSHWERELNLVQFWECPASFSKLSWPLVLVWFYTNTDFLLCRAGNADLCFPEGPVAPVRKSRNSLAILSHILWTCCRWGEASAALKGFPTALAAGQVFPWYLKLAENAL